MINIIYFRKKAIKIYCLPCRKKHKEKCVYKHSIDFRREKPCDHIDKPRERKLSARQKASDYFSDGVF